MTQGYRNGTIYGHLEHGRSENQLFMCTQRELFLPALMVAANKVFFVLRRGMYAMTNVIASPSLAVLSGNDIPRCRRGLVTNLPRRE